MRAVMQGGPHDGEGYDVPEGQETICFPAKPGYPLSQVIPPDVVRTDYYRRSVAYGTDAANIVYWVYEYEGRH